jgi:Domain of unknown function (DUF4145)
MKVDYRVSMFCPFCRQQTSPIPATKNVSTAFGDYTIHAEWERMSDDVWWIGICNYCKKPVLVHNNGDVIYPNPLPSPTDARIPESIRRDLDEAKACASVHAYRACAVMARRAMQSACIDKGTAKERLVDQLQELTTNGMITNDIREWADVVRWIGNDAAHPDKEEVTKTDAEDILKLAEQFLHVIYVAPAIAKEQRAKRGK